MIQTQNENQTQTAADPLALHTEQLAREKLVEGGWWTRADVHPCIPCSTEIAVELCQGSHYDVDVDDVLELIKIVQLTSPALVNGRHKWSATDIICLAQLLEVRRQWKFPSTIHTFKLNPYERALELAKMTGDDPSSEVFPDLCQFDLRALLILMAEAPVQQARDALRTAISIKLAALGVEC